jgi:hypothetical protein
MSDGPITPPFGVERFDYFMVRLSRISTEPERLSGEVERLGTGERRSFETGEQLMNLVAIWSASEPRAETSDRVLSPTLGEGQS